MNFPAKPITLTSFAKKPTTTPFTFKLPHVQAERDIMGTVDNQYLEWVAYLKALLRGKENLVMVRQLESSETLTPRQVICAADREIYVGQTVCLLRECMVAGVRELRPQYGRIGLVKAWTGPFVRVSLVVYDTMGHERADDFLILRSCFTVPPDLITLKPDIDYSVIQYPRIERYF